MKPKPAPPPIEAESLWKLAEILQMRRVERIDRDAHLVYYECQLCHGRSTDALGEIRHQDACPILGLK